MKAAIVHGPGQTPVFGSFPDPVPGEGDVRVRVTAAALSPLARGRASGAHYSAAGAFPSVAGVDGVGRLDDGRRVYFVLPRAPFGAMAEQTVVPAAQCIAVPEGLDDATAAAIANPGMSSWAALRERARLQPGETVLINGATGAAGRLAVRIARHLGAATVMATGRNTSALATLGADATIALDGTGEAIEDAFRARFAAGIDVVVDYLWGASARSLLVAAAKAGPDGRPIRFVQVGSAGGGEIALPAAVLRSSAIAMMGSGLGSVGLDRLVEAIRGVLGAAPAAGLALDHRRVPLADVGTTWAGPDQGRRIVYTTGAGAAER